MSVHFNCATKSGIRSASFVFAFLVVVTVPLAAQENDSADTWAAYRFLLGTWVAEGGGNPGQGSGTFSHVLDLQQRIIVRRNHVDYPAANGHPAFAHDDLMLFYRAANGSVEAQYFDNEGHVIHYTARSSAGMDSLILVSDVNAAAPRFRFTYIRQAKDTLKTIFDIAPPGRPEEFRRYVEGTVRRVK